MPWFEIKIEDPPPMLLLNSNSESYTPRSPSPKKREHWFELAEDYSKTFLSRESDRLPAITGLARMDYRIMNLKTQIQELRKEIQNLEAARKILVRSIFD